MDGDASGDEQKRAALTLELDARAARFHQAVDASIVLASDGVIRWLGDPIAKLAAGEDLLGPRTILLADAAMSEEAQKTALARLDLWLNATVQRLLGPLFSLRTLQEGSQQVQDLATRIAGAFGVLDREQVRGVVRNLDQNSRAVLRKHGVRFGSYYLYVPSTLRPAARALALQLSCIRKGDEDFSAAAQGLIPMASSGRTSAQADARVSAESYRVGGFRSCGDRVVRVDIVERLADMIRAGSVLRVVGSDSGPPAFQVTSQMTSLTGCSGDSFSSILQALGFESLTVRRSEVVWPAAAAPVAAAVESQAAAEAPPGPEGPGDGAATGADASADDAGETASQADSALDGPEADASEPFPAGEFADLSEESVSAEDGGDAESAGESADLPEESASPADGGDADPASDGPEAAAPAPSDVAPESDLSPHDGIAAAESDAPSADPAEQPGEADASPVAGTVTDAAAAPAEAASPAGDETITLWRFARPPAPNRQRRPRPARRNPSPQPAERRARPSGAPEGVAAEGAGGAAAPVGHPPEAPAPREKRAARFEKPFHGERKRWDAEKGQRPPPEKRDDRPRPEGRPGGDRKPAIDPMSPFAKLMELRSILEAESKKRK